MSDFFEQRPCCPPKVVLYGERWKCATCGRSGVVTSSMEPESSHGAIGVPGAVTGPKIWHGTDGLYSGSCARCGNQQAIDKTNELCARCHEVVWSTE